jgi:hypothetical protein
VSAAIASSRSGPYFTHARQSDRIEAIIALTKPMPILKIPGSYVYGGRLLDGDHLFDSTQGYHEQETRFSGRTLRGLYQMRWSANVGRPGSSPPRAGLSGRDVTFFVRWCLVALSYPITGTASILGGDYENTCPMFGEDNGPDSVRPCLWAMGQGTARVLPRLLPMVFRAHCTDIMFTFSLFTCIYLAVMNKSVSVCGASTGWPGEYEYWTPGSEVSEWPISPNRPGSSSRTRHHPDENGSAPRLQR